MDSKQALEIFEKEKEKNIFTLLNSKEELRSWLYIYLDIWFPMGHIYPTSNSSPIEAMWTIYNLYKTNETKNVPQVVMVSSRDSYKTLSAAAIEVLLFVHFQANISHAAAIKRQANDCISYINTMFRKIKKYLEASGWKKTSDNKTLIEWSTSDGEEIWLAVLTASKEGFNGKHCPVVVLDELDLMKSDAFAESRMVPSIHKGHNPLILLLSTRKYASGIMEDQIAKTPLINGKVLKWNIIDITEKISDKDAMIDKPKISKYISTKLPMRNLSVEKWEQLPESDKNNFELFEAYAGISEHPMLSVMKNYLVDRKAEDCGFLYKPLAAVYNNFQVSASDEFTDAQLLCNKPSSSGLVYPKFDSSANTLTIDEAYERLFGEEKTMTFDLLVQHMKSLGVIFYGGADWGFNDLTSLVVVALLANGDVWLMDCFTSPGLELDDIIQEAKPLQDYYDIKAWYCDTAYPAYIKTFNRKGMKAPTFEKDVQAGIVAIQRKLCDSLNKRSFFIIKTKNNEPVIDAFEKYRWKLDAKGEPTDKPEHTKKISDIVDSIRYPFQILFSEKNKVNFVFTSPGERKPNNNNELMRREIEIRTEGTVKPREPGAVQNTRGVKFLF